MTYNVFGGTLNHAQPNPVHFGCIWHVTIIVVNIQLQEYIRTNEDVYQKILLYEVSSR